MPRRSVGERSHTAWPRSLAAPTSSQASPLARIRAARPAALRRLGCESHAEDVEPPTTVRTAALTGVRTWCEHQHDHARPRAGHVSSSNPLSCCFLVAKTQSCPRFPPQNLNGKEGVCGSSPQEGFICRGFVGCDDPLCKRANAMRTWHANHLQCGCFSRPAVRTRGHARACAGHTTPRCSTRLTIDHPSGRSSAKRSSRIPKPQGTGSSRKRTR